MRCEICGNENDHFGMPHSEAMGDGLTRADIPVVNQPSFTCSRCGMTSYHPKDIEFGYCGHCHDYTGGESYG